MINNNSLLRFGLATIIVAIPFILYIFFNQHLTIPEFPNDSQENEEEEEEEKDTSGNNGNGENDTQEFYWGVDSASYTEENLFQCVVDNFGDPEVWGRYLETREGISYRLDEEEVNYLHEQDIQILVIYNHVTDARGYEHGVNHANQAIEFASNIDAPEGIAIFGDIEPNYSVDHSFMEGWYDTLIDSVYEPGIYGVFNEGSELMEAFEAMDEEPQENTIVWTAYPQEEITTKENAPPFNPEGPDLAPVFGWQYAIDAETCNIDTNLFTEDILDYLW